MTPHVRRSHRALQQTAEQIMSSYTPLPASSVFFRGPTEADLDAIHALEVKHARRHTLSSCPELQQLQPGCLVCRLLATLLTKQQPVRSFCSVYDKVGCAPKRQAPPHSSWQHDQPSPHLLWLLCSA
jgi:hypothetical protein